VIPTYNEAGNISEAIRRIKRQLPEIDILVVDDSSPDGTADVVRSLAEIYPNVEVIQRAGKLGLGSAYRLGFGVGLERGATSLVEMDADLSHEPESLPQLIRAVEEEGADLCIGSRYVRGGASPGLKTYRLLLSRAGNLYAALSLGIDIKDATSGFRVYSAEVLRKLDVDTVSADGYAFQIEMAFRVQAAHGRVVERPIIFRNRHLGASKMSFRVVTEAIFLCTVWGIQDRVARLTGNRDNYTHYHKDGSASVVKAIVHSARRQG
jgi:dolichol-phosphate mannosyltransferase